MRCAASGVGFGAIWVVASAHRSLRRPGPAGRRGRRLELSWRAMALDDYIHGRDERAVLERKMRAEGRLPPGQSLTLKWPVLHDGEVPDFDPAKWDFRVGGLVEDPLSVTWPELLALPRKEVKSDFHCVTRWSTFDNRWEGVPVPAVLERARPQREDTHVMVCGHKGDARYGYTTNLPLADL